MRNSRHILVQEVLLQLKGRGHPQVNATPNFFPDFKSSVLELSKNQASNKISPAYHADIKWLQCSKMILFQTLFSDFKL